MVKIIAVAGLIGSGKSTVAKILNDRISGFLFDCDKECEDIIRKDDFKEVFGFSLNGDDIITKKKFISDYIFGNEKKRKEYEKHIWKKCLEKFDKAVMKQGKRGCKIIVLDAPLLFQAGFEKRADRIVLVEADFETRKARFVKRGGSESDFIVRNKLQSEFFCDNEEYIGESVWKVIANDGDDLDALERAVDEVVSGLN
ncbi:MAG TPA: dephospho-CoA kinase [Spirochaetaceae bacterium]|nr:dephospho-CoA kinase [Spirochaetaceae bacterium]